MKLSLSLSVPLFFAASFAIAAPKATKATSASTASTEKPGLSAAEVKHVVESKMADFKKCLAVDPPPTGKLVVHYIISTAGKVERPGAKESSTGNAKLDGCIVDVFRKLEFPKPANGVAMEQLYPFTFAAPKAAPPAKLDEKVVVETVAAHNAEIKACMSEKTAGKSGTLTVELDIDQNGAVTAARKQSSTTTVDAFDTCVLTAAQKWQFPKPEGKGPLTLAFPIALNAKK